METRRTKKCKTCVGSSTRWNNVHADILESIFKNLSLGDRVRVGAVCRYWNLVLSQAKHDILKIPDTPWQILSEDYYGLPFIAEVSFKSLADEKIYRFNLPDDRNRGLLCASSRGWLLMATGDSFNPQLFPLNGSIKNLPPLSTHPCYTKYCDHVGGFVDITRVFDRVQVFSHDSAECVVATILNKRIYPRNQISFCMPHDKRWTTFGEKEDKTIYIDIMYHEKRNSLWLLTTGDLQTHTMEMLQLRGRVCLSGCTLPISFSFLLDRLFQDVDIFSDEIDLPQRSLTLKKARQVLRLVEEWQLILIESFVSITRTVLRK